MIRIGTDRQGIPRDRQVPDTHLISETTGTGRAGGMASIADLETWATRESSQFAQSWYALSDMGRKQLKSLAGPSTVRSPARHILRRPGPLRRQPSQ